LCKLHLASGW